MPVKMSRAPSQIPTSAVVATPIVRKRLTVLGIERPTTWLIRPEDENRAKDFDIRPASSQYFQKRECNGKNRGVFREIAVAADSSLKVRIVSFTE